MPLFLHEKSKRRTRTNCHDRREYFLEEDSIRKIPVKDELEHLLDLGSSRTHFLLGSVYTVISATATSRRRKD